jgi:hypothetical protein
MTDHLEVGDCVDVIDADETRRAGEAGRSGVVLAVRLYRDASYRYSHGYMVDGAMGGLYPGHWLRPTGERDALRGLQIDRRATPRKSTKVSARGDFVGSEDYVVLETVVD